MKSAPAIKNYFTNFFRSKLIKIYSLTAVSTIVKALTSFITVKVMAFLIGPSGIAFLGQLSNFSAIIMSIATGGINSGVTRYVAQHREDPSKIRLFLSTSLVVVLICSTLTGIFMISFSSYLSRIILLNEEYSMVFMLFGFTIVFYSLNNLLLSIINGYKEFKKFVQVNILSSFAGLLFSITLVWFYNLKGALISAVTYQSVTFLITLVLIYKSPWFSTLNFTLRASPLVIKKYLHYTLMTITSAVTIPVAQLILRGHLINTLSPEKAGMWEAMNRLSSLYLMVITSSFSVYYLPRLSEIKDKKTLTAELLAAFKVIIPILIIILTSVFFLKDFIILLLFSEDFLPMRELFLWQLLGDLFKIASWLICFVLISKSLTKWYIFNEVLFSLTFVLLGYLLINSFGMVGITQAYFINYVIFFPFLCLIYKKVIK